MRWCGLVLIVTACGRISFDPRVDGAFADDSQPVDAIAGDKFASVCADQRITIIRDGNAFDDSIAVNVPGFLAAGCSTNPTVTTVLQTDNGVLSPTTRQPLLPPTELGVMIGGDGPQQGLAYLIMNDSPITWNVGALATITVRATGTNIIDMVNYGPAHDYGVVMMVRDAITGTRYLSAQGPGGAGTDASGYYLKHIMAPTLSSDTHTWYVIEWMDTDTSGGASAADTFTVLASG
jgi:hypothetical protein